MECKNCKSKSMVCGQAFRHYICGHCFKKQLHHNTATPRLCKSCSENYKRCERCLEQLEEE